MPNAPEQSTLVATKKNLLLLLILTFAFASNLFAQPKEHFHILISNHYSKSFYKAENINPTVSGHYGYGAEARFIFGPKEDQINFGIGLAYNRIGDRKTYDFTPESATQKFNFHYVLLPMYTFIKWPQNWYSGIMVALEAPVETTWSSIHYGANGEVLEQYTGGSNISRRSNLGLGFGIVTGENIYLKNGLCIFIEGRFKAFNVITFLLDEEDDLFPYGQIPFSVGVNTGVKF